MLTRKVRFCRQVCSNILNSFKYFAGPHKFPDFDEKIQFLQGMGANEVDARAILSGHNWDLNRAVDQLLK